MGVSSSNWTSPHVPIGLCSTPTAIGVDSIGLDGKPHRLGCSERHAHGWSVLPHRSPIACNCLPRSGIGSCGVTIYGFQLLTRSPERSGWPQTRTLRLVPQYRTGLDARRTGLPVFPETVDADARQHRQARPTPAGAADARSAVRAAVRAMAPRIRPAGSAMRPVPPRRGRACARIAGESCARRKSRQEG
jgi:hypothetical protein